MTSVYNFDLTIQFADRFYVYDPLYKETGLCDVLIPKKHNQIYLVTTYLSVYLYIFSPVRRCALLNQGFPSTIKPTLPSFAVNANGGRWGKKLMIWWEG